MYRTPIFDTNVFIDASDGSIPSSDLRFLRRKRQRRNWPLSFVTATELLVGVSRVSEERFANAQNAIKIACEMSRGNVLNEAQAFVCKHVLGTAFPAQEVSHRKLSQMLLVVSRAKNKQEIEERKVVVRTSRKYNMVGGFDTALIDSLLAGPKGQWVALIGAMLDGLYAGWREHRVNSNFNLPGELRERFRSQEFWEQNRGELVKSFVDQFGPGLREKSLSDVGIAMDAVLTLAQSILREVLVRNYAFAEKDSDFYDLLQLHYLAVDRYIFVTREHRLLHYVRGSSQADRIMAFEDYLASL